MEDKLLAMEIRHLAEVNAARREGYINCMNLHSSIEEHLRNGEKRTRISYPYDR
jgi:hypothetical protein